MRGNCRNILAVRAPAHCCRPNGLPLRWAHRLTGLAATLVATAAVAIEPDPYTHRDMDLADSLEILDAKVNVALDRVAASWDRGEDEWAFVTAVYARLGSFHWVDPLERWAMDTPEVDKLPTTRRDAVFANVPLIRAQMARIGLARTINVNGVYIGTDKIGHFISQGRKFYRRVQRHGSEERAARLTAVWEGLIWGRLMSGIYSNADLVANYEGYRFFRGLFHGDMVAGKGPIFRWQSGRPVRQRTFTWADHVNPLWDEMLNPAATPHEDTVRRLRPTPGTLPNRALRSPERALPSARHARQRSPASDAVLVGPLSTRRRTGPARRP